ncbi:hypothetical protein [Tolypothrix sp. PCC 7910]|uniref:hypothetical protein n=1 Tax=Tolypothrix sp. PCC 7910 TaxID=2099387 RepID=UPI00143102E5|nr:hypothetical protein [Tolypothrix sp. PCC 7910]
MHLILRPEAKSIKAHSAINTFANLRGLIPVLTPFSLGFGKNKLIAAIAQRATFKRIGYITTKLF